MTSVFILRRTMRDARRSQAALEATPDLLVAGVADSLARARTLLEGSDGHVLLADLRLDDGNLLGLLNQMRAVQPASDHRSRVIAVATATDDPMLFGALRGGAESFLLDLDANEAPAPAIRRLLRGEANASAGMARQVLSFFGVASSSAMPSVNERALDWVGDGQNPLRLSRAEQHMLTLLSQGHGVGPIALRMGASVESIGRRMANIYRKIQWDVRSGSLSLQAA